MRHENERWEIVCEHCGIQRGRMSRYITTRPCGGCGTRISCEWQVLNANDPPNDGQARSLYLVSATDKAKQFRGWADDHVIRFLLDKSLRTIVCGSVIALTGNELKELTKTGHRTYVGKGCEAMAFEFALVSAIAAEGVK